MAGDSLWILLLEAGLALALLGFIVWWTMPTPPRSPGSTLVEANPDPDKGMVSSEHKPPEH